MSDEESDGVELEEEQLEETIDKELREEGLKTGLKDAAKEIEGKLVGVSIEEADSVDVMVEQIEKDVNGEIEIVGEILMVVVAQELGVNIGLVEKIKDMEREDEVVCVEDTDSVGVSVGL